MKCGFTILPSGRKYRCEKFSECPRCASTRSWRATEAVKAATAGRGLYYAVTLTFRDDYSEPAQQARTVKRHFSDLRNLKSWSQIIGGVWKVEHCPAHVHAIIEAEAEIDADRIAQDWARLTNGSYQIDVRRLDDYTQREALIGYALKPHHNYLGLPAQSVASLLRSVGGRSWSTFGEWRGKVALSRRRRGTTRIVNGTNQEISATNTSAPATVDAKDVSGIVLSSTPERTSRSDLPAMYAFARADAYPRPVPASYIESDAKAFGNSVMRLCASDPADTRTDANLAYSDIVAPSTVMPETPAQRDEIADAIHEILLSIAA